MPTYTTQNLVSGIVPNPASVAPGLRLVDGNDIYNLFFAVNSIADINLQLYPASGAISITDQNAIITKAGVAVMTLAAPVAGLQDLTEIQIISYTAFAHTITSTGNLATGSASVNTITFAAFAGASVDLQSYNGKWLVIGSNAATFS